jgi:hypothetical protein
MGASQNASKSSESAASYIVIRRRGAALAGVSLPVAGGVSLSSAVRSPSFAGLACSSLASAFGRLSSFESMDRAPV